MFIVLARLLIFLLIVFMACECFVGVVLTACEKASVCTARSSAICSSASAGYFLALYLLYILQLSRSSSQCFKTFLNLNEHVARTSSPTRLIPPRHFARIFDNSFENAFKASERMNCLSRLESFPPTNSIAIAGVITSIYLYFFFFNFHRIT